MADRGPIGLSRARVHRERHHDDLVGKGIGIDARGTGNDRGSNSADQGRLVLTGSRFENEHEELVCLSLVVVAAETRTPYTRDGVDDALDEGRGDVGGAP